MKNVTNLIVLLILIAAACFLGLHGFECSAGWLIFATIICAIRSTRIL